MSRMKIEKNIAWDDVKKKYYVTLYFGKDDNGITRKKTVTTTSKKEAQSILREHNKKMEAGTAVVPNKTTLVEYTREYIEYKALTLSQTTIYGYRNILKNHITPYFKKKSIQDITPKDIQDYITAKANTAISLQSIKKHVALLYSVFQNAYRGRIIDENPIDRLERIKAPSSKMECMNAQEISSLCSNLVGTQLEVPVKLAAYLGLRRGEVLGLKWEHVDFDNATIRICNTRTEAGHTVIEKQPKTERSNRQLQLTPELVDFLKRQQQKQASISRWTNEPQDYVVTMDNGKAFDPNYLSEAFHKHLVKNDYKPIRFHDLRHSFASIANNAGTSLRDISEAMGHSNISTTSDIYTHEFSQTKTKAVNAVALSIEHAKTPGNTCHTNTP